MRNERFQAIGVDDCGDLSLGYQSEVIELAKHLAGQEAQLRPFLETLVGELEQNRICLPTLPAMVTRVLKLASEREIEISDLAETVESDAALSAKIVGIGNTAYFARAGGATASVREALMRMGSQRAFDVVLMTALRSQLVPQGPLQERAESLWLESLRAGLTCQQLLAEVPPYQKTGFLLGLLHAIGRWAILGYASTLSTRGWTDRSLRPEILDGVGDALDAPLGGLVTDSWSYPKEFTLAIRNYRRPKQCEGDGRLLAQALNISISISERLGDGWLPEPEFPDATLLSKLEPLGVDADRLIQVADDVTIAFEVLSKVS